MNGDNHMLYSVYCKLFNNFCAKFENFQEFHFLGNINPKMADLTAPLNQLLRKAARWEWKSDQEKTWTQLKNKFSGSTLPIPASVTASIGSFCALSPLVCLFR